MGFLTNQNALKQQASWAAEQYLQEISGVKSTPCLQTG